MQSAKVSVSGFRRRLGRQHRIGLGLAVAGLLSGLSVVPAGAPTNAINIVPFDPPTFATNDNGAIFTIGNNLLTCPATAATCAGARDGTATGAASSNNAYSMVNLDADVDPGTFNSSASQLILPADSTVLWAGLYWGARRTGAPRSLDTTAPINQMSLGYAPDSLTQPTYQGVTSTRAFGPTGSDAAYQQFIEVTEFVQARGNGHYWGANVAAGLGTDRYAGWSMIVVYRNPTQPLRNLTVFSGFSDIAVNSSEVIPLSGFVTPPAPAVVNARINILAYEGDRGGTGDSAFLNSTRMATSASPGTNFFNSANDLDGRSVTTRTPADDNMLGLDMARTGVPGAIPNSARAASVTVSTTSERYYVGWFATQIDIFAPDFTTSRKTATNTSGRDPSSIGDEIEYALTYTNSGGDPATNSVTTDPLPPNTNLVPGSLTIDGAAPGNRAEVVTLLDPRDGIMKPTLRARLGSGADASAGGTIVPGATTVVRYRVTVERSAAGTDVRNQATLAYHALTLDEDLTYVGNETVNPVAFNADLSLTKTTGPDPVTAGAGATSQLSVTNNGPSAATDVVMTDTLSAGITASAATITGGTCTIVGQTVTCSVPTLANQATATATITATVPPSATSTTYGNTASVSSSVVDQDPSNNTATAAVGVVRVADVAISKVLAPDTPENPVPGSVVSYVVTVTNNGPSSAEGVQLTDVIDPRLAGAAPEGCVASGASVSCAIGTVAPGQSISRIVPVQVGSTLVDATLLPNTASVSSLTPDPLPSNNSSTVAFTTGVPQADLQVVKSGSATIIAGQSATYVVDVVNNGPSQAAAVSLTDTLPAGATAVSTSSTRGTCPTPTTCLLGAMPVGATASITFNVTFGPAAPLGLATNTATATSSTADPNPADNTATTTGTVIADADLSIRKSAEPPTAVPEQPVQFTLSIANAGPSAGRGVTVIDTLPAEFSFVSASSSQGTCAAPASGTLECAVGGVAVGQTVEVVVTMMVPAGFPGGDVVNAASVASAISIDPEPDDNAASFTVSADPTADLNVWKVGPSTVVAGAVATWTATVGNAGPFDADDVTFTDLLPAGLDPATVEATASTGATCTVAPTNVSCQLGTVASGATATITITARVLPGGESGDRLVNIASATSSTLDPTLSNNAARSGTDVTFETDLTATKRVLDLGFNEITSTPSGVPVIFEIVITNAGPSSAQNVTFVDTGTFEGAIAGPPGLENVCRILPNGQLECAAAAVLPPNQATEFYIVVVPLDDAGAYTNTADVATSTPETNVANNEGVAPLTLLAPQLALSAAKRSTTTLLAGGRFEYEVAVENAGPSIAQLATLTDDLPAGMIPDGATVDGGTCDIDDQVVTCTMDYLLPVTLGSPQAPIAPRFVTIVGSIAPGIAGSSVTNTAAVAATGDPDGASATTIDPLSRQSAVTVVKTAEQAMFTAGGEVAYSVAISNAGPSSATTATLTDLLPAGVTFDAAASDPQCVAVTDTVTCALAPVDPGTTTTVRIAGKLDPSFDGTELSNVASFGSDANTVPVASPIVTTPVVQSADLRSTKVATGDAVAAGTAAEFTITIFNQGPSTARDVVFNDQLPAGTTLGIVTPTAPLTCTSFPCAVGDLLPGETASVVVTVDIPADAPSGPLTNSVIAESPTPHPNPAARTAAATVEIIRTADLAVTKSLMTDTIVAGQPVTYQFVLTNSGPSDALEATITDAIPAGTSLVTGNIGGAPCEQTEIDDVPTVSCVAPTVPVGASVVGTLTLNTSITIAGTLTNTAIAGAQALDPADLDNTSTAQGIVTPPEPPTTPTTDVPPTTTTPATVPVTTVPTGPTTTPPPIRPPVGTLPATGTTIGVVLLVAAIALLSGTGVRGAAARRWRSSRRT